jgi:hypothetical protein
MDVPTGVKVECADGPCGSSQYVILDPASETITHVVVGAPGLSGDARLVPLSYVSEGTSRVIRLKCTRAVLQTLPLFAGYEYIKPDRPHLTYSPAEFWMGPLTTYWPAVKEEQNSLVPPSGLRIQHGAQVRATDGHAGQVIDFLVEPVSGRVTHLVLTRRHLWDHREVMVPTEEISRVEDDTVYLKVNREQVDKLPWFRLGMRQAGRLASPASPPDGSVTGTAAGLAEVRALVAELGSHDGAVRQNARLALARIGSPAVPSLAAALASGENRMRWEAAKALQQIGDPAAAPALVAALEDPDFSVRWLAAEGLMVLGRAGLIPLLQALETRPGSEWLRQGAHHVLRSFTDADLHRSVAEVLAALEDVEPVAEVPVAAHNVLTALQAADRSGRP